MRENRVIHLAPGKRHFDFVSSCWKISKTKLLQGEMRTRAHYVSPWKSEGKGYHKLAKYTQSSFRLSGMFVSLKDRELDIKNPSISVFVQGALNPTWLCTGLETPSLPQCKAWEASL